MKSKAGRPLEGRRILITRPLVDAKTLADSLVTKGGVPLIVPVFTVRKKASSATRQLFFENMSFDWVVFTSANGVRYFFELSRDYEVSISRRFAASRWAAVGKNTKKAVESHGFSVALTPRRFTGEALASALKRTAAPGERILLVQGERARPLVGRKLEEAGFAVYRCVVYDTVPDRNSVPRLQNVINQGNLDAVTFTSPSSVHFFFLLLEQAASYEQWRAMRRQICVACIGPVTAQGAKDAGLRVDVIARPHTASGLVDGLESFYRRRLDDEKA